jgi:hypothetical protein
MQNLVAEYCEMERDLGVADDEREIRAIALTKPSNSSNFSKTKIVLVCYFREMSETIDLSLYTTNHNSIFLQNLRTLPIKRQRSLFSSEWR